MNNLLYLKDCGFQTILCYECEERIVQSNYKKVVHNLCLQEYTSLSGRIEAVKEIFGFKYNIPIFINKKNILVKITQNEYNLWLNVYNIVGVKPIDELHTNILFVNNTFIIVEGSQKKVSSIIRKGLLVKNKTV